MIGYVRGQVSHLFVDYCFIDVQGVGYRLHISAATRQKLSVGTAVTLFTYLNVREDALLLYGFYSSDEYELFLQLISVAGIGPKVALGILSTVSPDDFRIAVSQKNISLLTKIPGIGKKTAERLILELKDKIGAIATGEERSDEASTVLNANDDVGSQALQALLALGYSQAEVAPALRKSAGAIKTVEEAIKLVLREMVSGR